MLNVKIKKLGYLGILLLLAGLTGCSGKKTEQAGPIEREISVKGKVVVVSAKELTKSFTGSLEGEQQAVITSKISEAVQKVTVRQGDFIKANDVLIMLDRSGPTSNYIQASSVFQNAEKNFNKMKYLFEQGAVSETQFDGAKTEYEVAKANFDAASQLVDIKTPISGMVTSIDVFTGDYLHPGQQLATVAAINHLRLKLGVSSSDIGSFKIGNEVSVRVESASDLTATGRVLKVARSADPETRSFQVEIEVDNAQHALLPGMFAKAEITVGKFARIIVVPRSAVVEREGKSFVFVVNGSRAAKKEIVMGIDFNGSSAIESGLKEGDTIITVGQNYLDEGFRIKLVRFVNEAGEESEL